MEDKDGKWHAAVSWLFARNWLTLLGASLTTASVLIIAGFVLLGLAGIVEGPYIGIIAFLIMPGFFIAGLVIIPIGAWWDRRRRARLGDPELARQSLTLDFSNPRVRRAAALVLFLTVINIFIIGSVSYKGVVYMESVEFCGQVCHTVMEPEFTAYSHSPHARVECVDCHIGPGAPWFVKSKLSGLRQVLAVLFHTYETPIPTPVHNLRPSRETCEQCHWPEKFAGDRMKVMSDFSDDESNTELKTALLLHIGGGSSEQHGIHSWHIDPRRVTRYLPASEDLQKISLVRVQAPDGKVTNFAAPDFEGDPAAIPDSQMKLMDCIDCHNRPTHIYQLPADALDDALASGRIDPTLPYIKKVGLEALLAADATQPKEEELQQIEQQVRAYYATELPDLAPEQMENVEHAIDELQDIYQRNIFPEMKVTWGTYVSNIGHDVEVNGQTFPRCFRCHDNEHTSADGVVISQDCDVCHSVLAWQEEDPEVLTTLGIE